MNGADVRRTAEPGQDLIAASTYERYVALPAPPGTAAGGYLPLNIRGSGIAFALGASFPRFPAK